MTEYVPYCIHYIIKVFVWNVPSKFPHFSQSVDESRPSENMQLPILLWVMPFSESNMEWRIMGYSPT